MFHSGYLTTSFYSLFATREAWDCQRLDGKLTTRNIKENMTKRQGTEKSLKVGSWTAKGTSRFKRCVPFSLSSKDKVTPRKSQRIQKYVWSFAYYCWNNKRDLKASLAKLAEPIKRVIAWKAGSLRGRDAAGRRLRGVDDATILAPIDHFQAPWEVVSYRSSGKGLRVGFLQTECHAGNV